MKIINNIKSQCFVRSSMLLLATAVCVLTACNDDDRVDVTPAEGSGNLNVVMYSPVRGTVDTELSIYGSSFPIDLSQIKVTVNDKDATVKSSNGRIIVVAVPEEAGSGAVKVSIGEGSSGREFILSPEFEYWNQMLMVETVTGGRNNRGNVDGTLAEAKFANPRYLAWGKEIDGDTELFVLEEGASPPTATDFFDLRRIHKGEVTTLWNSYTDPGADKPTKPTSICVSKDKNTIYMTEDANANGKFFKFDRQPDGSFTRSTLLTEVSTQMMVAAVHPITGDIFLGRYSNPSSIHKYNPATDDITAKLDIIGANATPRSMVFSKDGKKLYICYAYRGHSVMVADYDSATDAFSNLKVLAGPAALYPASAVNTTGFADALGTAARFNNPYQIDVDYDGNIYVADVDNHRIRKIAADGTTTTYAGTGTAGDAEGEPLSTQFRKPQGCQFSPDGSALYIADKDGHRIRRILMKGVSPTP